MIQREYAFNGDGFRLRIKHREWDTKRTVNLVVFDGKLSDAHCGEVGKELTRFYSFAEAFRYAKALYNWFSEAKKEHNQDSSPLMVGEDNSPLDI